MSEQRKKLRLGELLIQQGLVTPDQLGIALAEQKQNNIPIGRQLVRLGFITEAAIRDIMARTVGQESIDLAQVVADPEALKLVPQDFARRHRVLPIAYNTEERQLTIATTEIFNVVALDQLRASLGAGIEIKTQLAGEAQLVHGDHTAGVGREALAVYGEGGGTYLARGGDGEGIELHGGGAQREVELDLGARREAERALLGGQSGIKGLQYYRPGGHVRQAVDAQIIRKSLQRGSRRPGAGRILHPDARLGKIIAGFQIQDPAADGSSGGLDGSHDGSGEGDEDEHGQGEKTGEGLHERKTARLTGLKRAIANRQSDEGPRRHGR